MFIASNSDVSFSPIVAFWGECINTTKLARLTFSVLERRVNFYIRSGTFVISYVLAYVIPVSKYVLCVSNKYEIQAYLFLILSALCCFETL